MLLSCAKKWLNVSISLVFTNVDCVKFREADKRFFPKISAYWSKSHKHNLSKADTCVKRTKILVQPVIQRTDKSNKSSFGLEPKLNYQTRKTPNKMPKRAWIFQTRAGHALLKINFPQPNHMSIWNLELLELDLFIFMASMCFLLLINQSVFTFLSLKDLLLKSNYALPYFMCCPF